MVDERRMAIVACIVDATALHLDRDNVGWSVINVHNASADLD